MPHRKISGVKDTAIKKLPCGFSVLVVTLGADVAGEDYLANLFTSPLHINDGSLGNFRLDDPSRKTGQEAMTLAGHVLIFILEGKRIPSRENISLGDGTISFGHSVDVNRMQIEGCHLLEEMGCRWAGGDCNPDWDWESLGLLRVAKQGIDRGSGIEM